MKLEKERKKRPRCGQHSKRRTYSTVKMPKHTQSTMLQVSNQHMGRGGDTMVTKTVYVREMDSEGKRV